MSVEPRSSLVTNFKSIIIKVKQIEQQTRYLAFFKDALIKKKVLS